MNRAASILVALPLLLAVSLSHAQSAVDERAIIAATAALDAAIDAKDWAGARALLLDEVTVALPGEEATTMGADELVARWQAEFHDAKTTFHLRGGERVIFDGADSVVVRSRAQRFAQVESIAGDDLHELLSDYHHELDRTENGWRVRHYGYVPRLERGNAAVFHHRLPAPEADGSETEETPDETAGDAAAETGTASETPGDTVEAPSDAAEPAGGG